LKQFDAAIEATDILVHRARIGRLHDAQAAAVGARGDKDGIAAYEKYVRGVNRARKRRG